MGITVDVAYKSLNKYTEILCGDKVELLQTEDSNIMILADGMGSGVKANILSTLTSKILGTMFLNGATLEECVDTISETLPSVRSGRWLIPPSAYCRYIIMGMRIWWNMIIPDAFLSGTESLWRFRKMYGSCRARKSMNTDSKVKKAMP